VSGGGDPTVKEMITEFSKGLNINEFLNLYKATQDLRRVSIAAQGYADPQGGGTLDDLITLNNDPTLDPMARRMAGQFGAYLPQSAQFQENLSDFGDDATVNGRLVGGEKFLKEPKGKVQILDQDDNLVMKPSFGDDPRFLKMVAQTMEGMLMPPDKEGKKDPKMGFQVAATQDSSSGVIKETNKYLTDLAKAFDRPRAMKMIQSGTQQLTAQKAREQEQLEKAKEKELTQKVVEKRKKGFGFLDK
jgi:hypothetical protein